MKILTILKEFFYTLALLLASYLSKISSILGTFSFYFKGIINILLLVSNIFKEEN